MIIGFIGLMQAGKTTACKPLMDLGWKKVGFKDALVKEMKERVPNMLNALSDEYDLSIDDLFLIKPKLMRTLMQDYGTGIRRADDEDYWVDRWGDMVWELEQKGVNVCIDDVRFKNELQAVKDMEGIIIRVIKTGQQNLSSHASERELETAEADYIIEAEEGDVESIYRQVTDILGLIHR